MFEPRIRAAEAVTPSQPLKAMVRVIVIAADDDWTITVTAVPIRTQVKIINSESLLNELRNLRASTFPLKSGMDFCIKLRPRKSRPNPSKISAISRI